jgi:hypothetical protein
VTWDTGDVRNAVAGAVVECASRGILPEFASFSVVDEITGSIYKATANSLTVVLGWFAYQLRKYMGRIALHNRHISF